MFAPKRGIETTTTFADMLAASEERAERARGTRRALSLRLLTWGQSRNPYLNALLKLEYVATFPLRMVLAVIAAPFALHNRPLGAMMSFLALFGFWEVFEGFAKQPILSLYQAKSLEYQTEAVAKDPNSMGDVLNSNYKAAKWLVGLPFKLIFGANGTDATRRAAKTNAIDAAPDSVVRKLSGAINRAMSGERQSISVLPPPEKVDKGIKEGLNAALGLSNNPDTTNPALEGMPGYPSKSKKSSGLDGAVQQLSGTADQENRRAFDQSLRNLHEAGDHTTEAANRDTARRVAAIEMKIAEKREQNARVEIEEDRKKAEAAIKRGECINKPAREVFRGHLGLPCEQLYQPLEEAGLCHGGDDCRDYVTRLQNEANKENQLTQPNNQ